ncbi:MAG TPA: hypothetical protein DCZ92_10745 [Elusimicrobia bacterium]|nr:MAG: hypothetical protein A2016_04435 [Elusimicrobia bacterium GWF2_62_30]HBA61272.1 hypothetical protein [Elusimicrobiota bacterium]
MRELKLLAVLACLAAPAAAQTAKPAEGDKPTAFAAKSPVPSYIAAESNLGKYYLYADGGFNADWYVGYNNCWVIKLPPVAAGAYAKAFIGAKLGRAKIMSWPMSWDPAPIPGKIYLAINNAPSFNSDHTYFLVDAADLPREPLPNDYLDGVDSARWLWTEIPLSRISSEKPNYMALWSSSRYFVSSSSAPIIAAAKSDSTEDDVWLSRSIRGNPPSGDSAFEIPISGIKPAIAIKLVPANEYKVFIKGFSAEVGPDDIMVSFAAIGEDIRAAWLEVSYDKFDWQRVTRYLFKAPYFWSFGRDEISKEMFYLRAAAVDNLENTGYSKEIVIPAMGRAALPAPAEAN